MSPLYRGQKNFQRNVNELTTQPILSPARKKAIITLAKRKNLTFNQAKSYQANAIAGSLARKKK